MNTKNILVTGATGAIGEALCHYLASKNYNLVLAARNWEKLTILQGKLEAKHPNLNIEVLELDFSKVSEIETAFREMRESSKKLTGLVLMPPQVPPTGECLPHSSEWNKIFSESFVGPLEVVKEAIKLFDQDVRAKIAIVSGISSAQVLGHYATSNVLRLMWLAQAKTLAHALGPKKIHVNTVSFGGIQTPKYKTKLEEKARTHNISLDKLEAQDVDNVPLRKYATLEEAAHAIEGLLSDFTDHITGTNILCDGGFTRAY